MSQLSSNELLNITGGGIGKGIALGLVAFGILVIGIIDGYLRPSACNK